MYSLKPDELADLGNESIAPFMEELRNFRKTYDQNEADAKAFILGQNIHKAEALIMQKKNSPMHQPHQVFLK